MGLPKFYGSFLRGWRGIFLRFPLPTVSGLAIDGNALFYLAAILTFKDDPSFSDAERQQVKVKLATMDGAIELEREFHLAIQQLLSTIIQLYRPQEYFMLAVDGVAPLLKIQHQRQRRFRSFKAAQVKGTEPNFHTSTISPGTVRMFGIDQMLAGRPASDKQQAQIGWLDQYALDGRMPPKIIYSGHMVPGEGEHKIMQAFRDGLLPGQQLHLVHSLDSDLSLLCLALGRSNLVWVRPGQGNNEPDSLISIDALKVSIDDTLGVRDVAELHANTEPSRKSPITTEVASSTVNDFVALASMIGNDFLPAAPELMLTPFNMTLLISAYTRITSPLVQNGQLQLLGLRQLLTELLKQQALALKQLSDLREYPFWASKMAVKGDQIDIALFRQYWYRQWGPHALWWQWQNSLQLAPDKSAGSDSSTKPVNSSTDTVMLLDGKPVGTNNFTRPEQTPLLQLLATNWPERQEQSLSLLDNLTADVGMEQIDSLITGADYCANMVAADYCQVLRWIISYYFHGPDSINKNLSYPHFRSPMISDISAYVESLPQWPSDEELAELAESDVPMVQSNLAQHFVPLELLDPTTSASTSLQPIWRQQGPEITVLHQLLIIIPDLRLLPEFLQTAIIATVPELSCNDFLVDLAGTPNEPERVPGRRPPALISEHAVALLPPIDLLALDRAISKIAEITRRDYATTKPFMRDLTSKEWQYKLQEYQNKLFSADPRAYHQRQIEEANRIRASNRARRGKRGGDRGRGDGSGSNRRGRGRGDGNYRSRAEGGDGAGRGRAGRSRDSDLSSDDKPGYVPRGRGNYEGRGRGRSRGSRSRPPSIQQYQNVGHYHAVGYTSNSDFPDYNDNYSDAPPVDLATNTLETIPLKNDDPWDH